MTNRFRSLLALAVLSCAACNSYQPRWSTNPTFNTPVGSLALTLAPTTIDLSAGPATLSATLTPSDGFTGLVQFNPVGDKLFGLVITPGSIDLEGTAPVTLQLTFTATNAAATGAENIQVAAAVDNQSTEAALTVTAN